jgi:hypothetical protein
MTDYLTNLAARSVNATGDVRPRLASSFEQSMLDARGPAVTNDHAVEVNRPATPATGGAVPDPRRTTSGAPPSAIVRPPPEEPHASEPPRSAAGAAFGDRIVARPSMVTTTERLPAVSHQDRPQHDIAPEASAALRPRAPERPTEPVATPRVEVSNREPHQPTPHTPDYRIAGLAEHVRQLIARDLANVVSRRDRRPPPLEIARPTRPSGDPMRSAATPLAVKIAMSREVPAVVPAPAPVCVTIGRVEVRATVASPPSKRAATRREPAVSLGAYLRKRAGGERP